MFRLPFEICSIIFDQLSVKEITAVYKAYKTEPSIKQLQTLFVQRELLSSFSIDSLAYFEELSPDVRLKLCVQIHDVNSFRRLHKGQYIQLNENTNKEIVECYLKRRLEGHCLAADLELAVYNRLYSITASILAKGVKLDIGRILVYREDELQNLIPYLQQVYYNVFLGLAIRMGYYRVAKHLLALGAIGPHVRYISGDIPDEILFALTITTSATTKRLIQIATSRGHSEFVCQLVAKNQVKMEDMSPKTLAILIINNKLSKDDAYAAIGSANAALKLAYLTKDVQKATEYYRKGGRHAVAEQWLRTAYIEEAKLIQNSVNSLLT